MDAYKLREIFLLLEKFTNIYTLRLFYLALENTSPNDTLSLFDFDVMKVLHNAIKYMENCDKKINNYDKDKLINKEN